MSKLSVTEAVKVIPQSESTLRRDLRSGKVSFETDPKGRKRIDIAELQRVYGSLNGQNGSHPPEASSEDAEPAIHSHQNDAMNETDTPKIVELLEKQVAMLTAQLDESMAREKTTLELADRLQKQNELLMLPAPKPKRSWRDIFRLT